MRDPEPMTEMDLELPDPTESNLWPYEALKRFRLIFRAVQQHSQWVESCCGVTCAQLWAMSELAIKPGLRVTDLAKSMSVHQTTISNLLVKLEKKGLIRRERSDPDRRVVCLYLTAEGQELLARAPGPRRGLLQQSLFGLPEPVLASLVQNLDALVEAIQIKDTEAAMQPLSVTSTPED